MNSPISLAIVFFGFAYFICGLPGVHHGPTDYVLAAALGISSVLILLRLRVAYYAGLVSAGAVAIFGVVTWLRLGVFTMTQGTQIVLGFYMCFRVALAHRVFGAKRERRPVSDELPEGT